MVIFKTILGYQDTYCIYIPVWFIFSGWTYLFIFIGAKYNIDWMLISGIVWSTFLWMPFTPEKLVTIPITIKLYIKLFKNNNPNLDKMLVEAKQDFKTIKSKVSNLMKKLLPQLKEFNNTNYGTLICVCWVVLLFSLVVKLLGLESFELFSENEKFISFCTYVDNHQPLKMIIACILYLGSGLMIISVMLKHKLSFKEHLLFVPVMIFKSVISWYLPIHAFVIDLFILLGITTILNKNFKRNALSTLIISIFQVISSVIRGLSVFMNDFNMFHDFITQLLSQVDYYIMIILYYLYTFNTKRKEV